MLLWQTGGGDKPPHFLSLTIVMTEFMFNSAGLHVWNKGYRPVLNWDILSYCVPFLKIKRDILSFMYTWSTLYNMGMPALLYLPIDIHGHKQAEIDSFGALTVSVCVLICFQMRGSQRHVCAKGCVQEEGTDTKS